MKLDSTKTLKSQGQYITGPAAAGVSHLNSPIMSLRSFWSDKSCQCRFKINHSGTHSLRNTRRKSEDLKQPKKLRPFEMSVLNQSAHCAIDYFNLGGYSLRNFKIS